MSDTKLKQQMTNKMLVGLINGLLLEAIVVMLVVLVYNTVMHKGATHDFGVHVLFESRKR